MESSPKGPDPLQEGGIMRSPKRERVFCCAKHPKYAGVGRPPKGCVICGARRWVRVKKGI